MTRRWLLFLVCIGCALSFFSQATDARFDISVDEAATRVFLKELAPEVSLVVKNGSKNSTRAVVRVELLEPNNTVKAVSERSVDLKSGTQKLPFVLPTRTRDVTPEEDDEILWYRLHYRISPEASGPNRQVIEGFISLSEITPDLFELKVLAPKNVTPGKTYAATVRASHPLTRKPFKNVEIKGLITLPENDRTGTSVLSSAVTNTDGFAELNFLIPENISRNVVELNIEGRLGLITVEADRELEVTKNSSLLVSTDKPLYQPGQTLFARLLILGPSKRVLAGKEIEVEIEDPEGTTVFNSTVETSRFGIASIEWPIPDNTRLGDYRIEFSQADDDDNSAYAIVKISRYDLPNFAVTIKPDRPYYLPGQDATVEVRADYLFGKPVTKGHVRVVRETSREWNYREQKYETTEGDKYEGATLADGMFQARIPLAEDHENLATEDYNRFTDLSYAAYFTDSTTNRTEQRRFNLRLSKSPIHVYVIHVRDSYHTSRKLPLSFYVSTSYADGTPVSANLSVRSGSEGLASLGVLKQVRTNRYGLARIDDLKLPLEELEKSRIEIDFVARDTKGNEGRQSETFLLREEPTIRVRTTKALLADGEPIETSIFSSEPSLPLTVTVTRNGVVVHSQQVKLHDGKASFLIPYKKEFKDDLTISAYADSSDLTEDDDLVTGAHTVLYPRRRDLKLNLVTNAQTYKPGEQAAVSFQTTSAQGRAVESALGVVVTDKAVDERVRTDQEFGSGYGGFYSQVFRLMGYGQSIGEISRKSLDELDMTKPVSKDLALAAEIILNQGYSYDEMAFGGYGYDHDQERVFKPVLEKQLLPLTDALGKIYADTRVYPKNEETLNRLLGGVGISLGNFKDPWGNSFRPVFFPERENDVFALKSAGADKRFDTSDDFSFSRVTWPYFRSTGELIEAAGKEYYNSTAGYIGSIEVLRAVLQKKNFNLDELRDPWNQPYRFYFSVNGSYLEIRVYTREPVTRKDEESYEFQVWHSRVDYFAETRSKIDAALAQYIQEPGLWPTKINEFRATLDKVDFDWSKFRDPWGRNLYTNFQVASYYTDRVQVESRATNGQPNNDKLKLTPITRKANIIKIRSAGADGLEGSSDDFDVATYSAPFSEQSASDPNPQLPRANVSFSGSKGAISGTVNDQNGAAVTGVKVIAKLQGSEEVFETESDDSGKYLLGNVPAGVYELRASSPGFTLAVIAEIVVRSTEVVEVDITLTVSSATETVTITSSAVESLNLSTNASRSVSNLLLLAPGVVGAKQQLSTPRVREYFPETLLWQPQLTTDKKGRAQLDFKLADNITTWRMSVIGSTEDGELGTAETEIRAFQPFFAELDPPRVLTEGDRISLPVVLRNYLERRLSVDLTLKPESWFKVLDSNQRRSLVSPGDSKNEFFNIQAVASIKNGKQQVTAIGSESSDAIEKPVTVHPDGEEKAESTSDLLDTNSTLAVNLPEDTIANSANVEVKIYPNLMTHVWESVEAIMQRPYGCGEQTISSTYPSLLVLRHIKKEKIDDPISAKAKKYLAEGYQRLLSYQSSTGGFSYWSNGEPDVALTAYAVRFLKDASSVMTVDGGVVLRATQWLRNHQQNGKWIALTWDKKEDVRRTAMLTAVVARTIAGSNTDSANQVEKASLQKVLDYLETQADRIDEPYLIASYSLASALSGETARAEKANAKLKNLAHKEGSRTYWTLEANTPFYGWGLAGRIETTALVVQALSLGPYGAEPESRDLQTRALLFLLRNQDRYGVWYSTQATINVLDALLSLMNQRSSSTSDKNNSPVEVLVNGRVVHSIALPSDKRMTAPLTVDVSANIQKGQNRIEFRRPGGSSPVSVQVVNTYYVPWNRGVAAAPVRAGDSGALKLETHCDKLAAKVTEEITCRVKAERVGFRGYGMMLAEIGLPPGADVDRASLETAMRGSDWTINRYDVLPDRVVVYLWPKAGGSEFSFKFRPRMAMTAKASASTIYDYYNPEAKATVAPSTFVVR